MRALSRRASRAATVQPASPSESAARCAARRRGCRRPMLEEGRAESRVSRKRSPARTALTGEAPRRSLRLRPCRLAVAFQKCRLGEHEPSLGGLGDHLPFQTARKPPALRPRAPRRPAGPTGAARSDRSARSVAPRAGRLGRLAARGRGRSSRAQPERRRAGRRPSRGCARLRPVRDRGSSSE